MDLKGLTTEVCRIARMAGQFIKNERLGFKPDAVEQKKAHDYVSYVDRASERMIVTELHNLLPEAGFIVEEGTAGYTGEAYSWVVDPLDGTTNFIHNMSPYCVSIALRSKTELLIGVVYDPVRDECFHAWKGGGAFVNSTPIYVSDTSSMDKAIAVIELPCDADGYGLTAENLMKSLYGRVTAVRVIGSAALGISYVAAGRIDIWTEAYLGRWDFSAAALLVQEAGGKVTDFRGSESFLDGNHIIATNRLLHDEVQGIVSRQLPKGI